MASVKTHQALLALLQEKEISGAAVTLAEILACTGWKESTYLTYWNKGQLSQFLNETAPNTYAASNVVALDDAAFTGMLSQSKHRRELGHNCRSRLAKALLRKSRDNMLLALELYNRPSLDNRMDAFVLCFCTAWEQLLKAILVERDGEESIFRAATKKKAGIRETISLRACLERNYQKDDLVRRNLERITYYRDQAVHLLMPEIQGPVSRLFQSGVMNYGQAFDAFAKQPFISEARSGLLTMVGDLRTPNHAFLRSRYGEQVGDEVAELAANLTSESESVDDMAFAIPLSVRWTFERRDANGKTLAVASADEGIEGLRKAVVVEKPVEREKTHPHLQRDAIAAINQMLRERYSDDDLPKALVKKDREDGRPAINTRDFQAVAWKLKWKRSNNREHHRSTNPELRHYSDLAVEEFVAKVMEDPDFLRRTRESYAHDQKKRRN
ncbi:MAG: DUF3644 domain-containing protein [Gammaproteobacteria bacterium]|nr:DUF3644 domain-containing protein [Gammaproteobacteria bacterium]